MVKAVVLGAAGKSMPTDLLKRLTFVGGIGQPLSLLLKINPLITEVRFWYRTLYSNGP